MIFKISFITSIFINYLIIIFLLIFISCEPFKPEDLMFKIKSLMRDRCHCCRLHCTVDNAYVYFLFNKDITKPMYVNSKLG